jgi:protein-S-isoprenylcysteine O-methyltransferase Ste14
MPERHHILVRLPPPLLYVTAFVAGVAIQRHTGLKDLQLPGWLHLLGGALTLLGLALVSTSMLLLVSRRTTVVPHGTPSHLVAQGPFRYTRNPIYLGLAFLYIGPSLRQDNLVTLITLIPVLIFLDRVTIPFEEASLKKRLGAEYDAYRSSVRRWL